MITEFEMTMKKCSFFLMLILSGSWDGVHADATRLPINAKIQKQASALLTRGVAVRTVNGDETTRIFYKDAKLKSARFEIGSISKCFTGISVVFLSQQGKLDLEAPISNYVPELSGTFVGTVSSRQLGTHMARIVGAFIDSTGSVNENYPEAELISFLKGYYPDPKQFLPGQWRYSNLGFATLGLVMSRIEKLSYTKIIQKSVFAPLLMTHSGFITTPNPPA